jgi:putative transcriptional regulator
MRVGRGYSAMHERAGRGGTRSAQGAQALAAVVTLAALAAASLSGQAWPADGRVAAATRAPERSSASQLAWSRGTEPAPGTLLVAARGLPDPNFAKTLVLLVAHDDDGAMGFVVNQPLDLPLARLFKGLRIAGAGTATAFSGGPVQASGITALIRSKVPVDGALPVVGEIHIVRSGEVMKRWLASESDHERVRVFLGYAGWGPGQVEKEWEAGVWHALDADADAVFDPNPGTAWERQVRRTEWQRASR